MSAYNGINLSSPKEMANNVEKSRVKNNNKRLKENFPKKGGFTDKILSANPYWNLMRDIIENGLGVGSVLKITGTGEPVTKPTRKAKPTIEKPIVKSSSNVNSNSTSNINSNSTYNFGDMTIDKVRANLSDISKMDEYRETPYANYNSSMSDEDSINLFKKYLDELNAKLNIIPPTLGIPKETIVEESIPKINLSSQDTNAILSHYGYKPNTEWSDALRKYLSGDRSLNMSWASENLRKEWMTPGYGVFTVFRKKGGTLVSKNVIERFQNGKYFLVPKKASEIFPKTTKLIEEQDKKVDLVKQATERAGLKKKSTSPVILNNTAQLLKHLYDIGAFGNLSFEKAVDGIKGKLTNNAIKKAKQMGYNVDETSGAITKQPKTVTKPTNLQQKKTDSNALNLIRQSVKETGNMLEETKREALNNLESKRTQTWDPISAFGNRMLNNMYPYSYGDKLTNGEENIAYSGQDIPEGYRLTLVWDKDDKELLQEALNGKLKASVMGKDPRREYMEAMSKIDLSTPRGVALWNEMVKKAPSGMTRISGNPVNELFEQRARLDASNYYTNGKLLYNIWELNPDFSSPTAVSKGRGTYRIADPVQRERIYGEMINWWLKNKNKGRWNEDHTAYIVPSMGFMGNHSLISDDENGLNLRYGDWWDYAINTPNSLIMYIGDRLVPKGSYPKPTKYGVGHNYSALVESADLNMWEMIFGENKNKDVPAYIPMRAGMR